MDIESLYTNVSFEGDLQAAKFFLDKRTGYNPSTLCILDLAESVLSSNYFLFGADLYLQMSRVAMGLKMLKMSPSFASLNMGLFECEMIFNQELNPYLHHISHWKHYFMCLWTWKMNILNFPWLWILTIWTFWTFWWQGRGTSYKQTCITKTQINPHYYMVTPTIPHPLKRASQSHNHKYESTL